jgi:holo-[acyl-carrier protein] synthase
VAARVGIDLVAVDDVHDSIRAHGDRWLRRVFTERELRDCGTGRGAARRLAARFAAKEAALKVLADPREAVPWRDIELYRADGAVHLQLDGAAARGAAAAGLERFAVSVTHRDGYAAAVVIAQTAAAPRSPSPSTHRGAPPGR